jgi:hypothetical protein
VFVTLGFWHYLPRHVAPWAAAAVVVVWGGMFAWGTVLTVQYIARDRRQPDEEGRS